MVGIKKEECQVVHPLLTSATPSFCFGKAPAC